VYYIVLFMKLTGTCLSI